MKKKKPALKVLGCPWCGKKPKLLMSVEADYWYECPACFTGALGMYARKTTALKVWNRRARRKVYTVEAG